MSALIVDTGGWLLALSGEEPYATVLRAADEAIIPGLVLAEVDYHLRKRRPQMHQLLREIAEGAYIYEPPTAADLSRALEIDRKYKQLFLGLVDASIAALAERLDMRRLLTIDSDFVPLRIGARWERPLELVIPPNLRPS